MGIVIRLPKSHARTPSRAANPVKVSADIPEFFATSVDRIADHHSAGTPSRCHHLDTAEARAPMSDAIASREGHSSIIDRNDAKSDIAESIRQTVLKYKDNTSLDLGISLGQNVLMRPEETTKEFKEQFTARIAHARHKAGYTQSEMAYELGFGELGDPSAQSKYQKYEKRSFMPHQMIRKFCSLCDVTTGWLFDGPIVARPVEKRGRKPKTELPQKLRKRA